MLIYASACAVLLLAGFAEAEPRPTPSRHPRGLVVTNTYADWYHSADACFKIGKVPAFLSKENFRKAGKVLRQSGHRHAWFQAVRSGGKWVGERLKLQLPASARKLNNRDLKEGERGEIVKETNTDVVHVTLCEDPGSHKPRGYRRHSTSSRHRRRHRHHHNRRRHDRSRDRGSYSLDRRDDDYKDHTRSLTYDSHDRNYRSYDDRRDRRRDRGRALRRTGGGWADSQSTDSERERRREREPERSRDGERSYDRRDRHRSSRHHRARSVSSDYYNRRHRRSSYSDDSSKYDSRSYSSDDDYSRRSSRRSRSRRSSRRSRSRRDRDEKGHHDTKEFLSGGVCPGGSDPSKCPIQHLLNQPNPRFI